MTFYLDLAPLAAKFTACIDQKSAALDAHELATVQRFFLDDVKLATQFLIRIGQQLKWKRLFLPEFFVCGDVVARDTEDHSIQASKLAVQITKVLPLGGATGRGILGVKVENHVLSTQIPELYGLVSSRSAFEIRDNAIE